ncbi:cell wall [Fusarium longipes]|uniref:Cell wall n=1 Tax=Fusarium longipes TaxID=694270 RepID=A0A395SRE6_9HYPO|nr:cell wall [Fusarium longipes]
MQFKNIILTPLVAAGIASAAPNPEVKVFQAVALRSASPVHHTYLQAADGGLSLKLKDQGASCDAGVKEDAATFTLNTKTKEMLLYSRSNPRQQVYTDRSGMGQGLIGYRTGAQPLCTRCEQDKWSINENNFLQYDDRDNFIACPRDDGSYSVWASAGVDNPGWNKDCVSITFAISEVKKPVGCLYTQPQQ